MLWCTVNIHDAVEYGRALGATSDLHLGLSTLVSRGYSISAVLMPCPVGISSPNKKALLQLTKVPAVCAKSNKGSPSHWPAHGAHTPFGFSAALIGCLEGNTDLLFIRIARDIDMGSDCAIGGHVRRFGSMSNGSGFCGLGSRIEYDALRME